MTIRDRANVIDTSRISLLMLIIANEIFETNCSRGDLYVNGMFSTWQNVITMAQDGSRKINIADKGTRLKVVLNILL